MQRHYNLNYKKPESFVGEYIKEELLGSGSYASVWKARHRVSNEVVAIKDIKIGKMMERNLAQEIEIMRNVNHPSIVRLLDYIKTPTHAYLVMEYCAVGDLHYFLRDHCNGKCMSQADLLHFLEQIAAGMKYLRSNLLIHRDIKPQNILLAPSTSGHHLPDIKIADFGFAKFLPSAASLTSSICGSPLYMAPEIFLQQGMMYDAKADLWSIGAVLYEMMMGRKFCEANDLCELQIFLRNYKDQVDFSGSKFSNELKDLVCCLLKKNPQERISCEEFCDRVELLTAESDSDSFIVIERTAYSSSVPPHTFEPTYERERKFSLGSNISKALSLASCKFFGVSTSDESNASSPSIATPATLPTIPDDIVPDLVFKEITLDKLLVSEYLTNTIYAPNEIDPTFLSKVKHWLKLVTEVKEFADQKLIMSDQDPMYQLWAEECMLLYRKSIDLLNMALKEVDDFQTQVSGIMIGMHELNAQKETMKRKLLVSKSRYENMLERAGLEHDEKCTQNVTVEGLLYGKGVDLSKAASVQQLLPEELEASLSKYYQAVHLLEAVTLFDKSNTVIKDDDLYLVNKLIEQVRCRISSITRHIKLNQAMHGL